MRCAAIAAALAVVAAWGHASAEEPVRIDFGCPALSGEQQVALETRLRASLAVTRAHGRLVVGCEGERFRATWHAESGGAPVEQTGAIPADPASLPDAILETAERVSRPVETPATPTAAHPAEQASVPATQPAADTDREAPAPETTGVSFGLTLGTLAEFWWSSPPLVLGPRLGLDLELGRISAEVAAGVRSGIDPGADLAVRMVHLAAAVDGAFGEARHIGVGGGFEACFVTFSTDTLTASSQRSTAFNVFARGRWLLHVGPIRFAVGPELRLYLRSSVVYVDGVEVVRIPFVTGGIAIDMRAAILGTK